jgi:dephospho-CoA kinase
MLQDLGAGVIDSDALAREVMESPEIVTAVRAAWGDQAITPEGKVDRVGLRRVFDDPEQRRRLEALIHPRVADRREAMLSRFDADPNCVAVVLDSPLLFEAGVADTCDAVIFVDADEATRLRRVTETRGWSPQELARREKSQDPLADKKQKADYTVSNLSTVDALHRQVAEVFSRLIAAFPGE